MQRGLAVADLGDLLTLPIVAVLAPRRADGSVLLSPVWHEWRDDGFSVVTGGDDVKLRHLRRDPRAVLLVAESDTPYRGVEIRAVARLTDEGAAEALSRIAVRYLGDEAGNLYADAWPEDQTLIRLEPSDSSSIRAWDFADEF